MVGGRIVKRLVVYSGSSYGASHAYQQSAIQLGKELAARNITLVYGGASVGLMGVLADTVLRQGGKVIGVIPSFLEEREIAHPYVTELYTVETMHERKEKMASLADGFIALPGGIGTLEEFFEVFTWAQLGIHKKPCGILNINDYYAPLQHMLDHMVNEQFLHEKHRSIPFVDTDPKQLLDRFKTYQQSPVRTYTK